MKKNILLFIIFVLSVFGLNNYVFGNEINIEINKEVSSSTQITKLKYNNNGNIENQNKSFKVLTKNNSSIYNYNGAKYINLNLNFSNLKAIKGLFLTPAEQEGEYVDTFSYGMGNINIGGNKYSNFGYYVFIENGDNNNLVIKSFIDVKDKNTLKNVLGDLYNTYNPKYLAYNVLYKFQGQTYKGFNNSFKEYINNLSYSDRINLIKDISNNGYKELDIDGKTYYIIGFQKNPLFNSSVNDNDNIDFINKENNTIKTIYTGNGYALYNKVGNNYNYLNTYDIFNKYDYIATNGFMNEDKFISIPDINLSGGVYYGFVGFIVDLYNGYSNKNNEYNGYDDNSLNINFGITTSNGDEFIPTFLGDFKIEFINDVNNLLVNYNKTFDDILKYVKILYINNQSMSDIYSGVDIYNNDNLSSLVYDYNIGYIRIDNSIYKNTDNTTNIIYNYAGFIPVSGNILYYNKEDYNNSDIIYNDYISLSDTNLYNNTYCYKQYGTDEYIKNNKKHKDIGITFINNCPDFEKVKHNDGYTVIDINSQYPYIDSKLIYQKNISNYNVDYTQNKGYGKYNIILAKNFPDILPAQKESQMTSIFYLDNQQYVLNTDNNNQYISNGNLDDGNYYIKSNTYNNTTGIVISLFNNKKDILSFNNNGDLIKETLKPIGSMDINKTINQKALGLFILSTLNNKEILTNEDKNINLDINNIDSIPQIIYYKTGDNIIASIEFLAYSGSDLKNYYINYNFNNSYNVEIEKVNELSNYKQCNNYIPYKVNYNYIIQDTISLGICDYLAFNNKTSNLNYNIGYKDNIKNYIINDNSTINKEYGITNFKRFENKDYNTLKSYGYLGPDNNYNDSKYSYFKYFISLIDDDYKDIFKHNVFVKQALPKKDFLVYPKNNSTSGEIFAVYNDDNIIESKFFNINSDVVNQKYIDYIENDIKYTYSGGNQSILYHLDNSSTVDKIEKNKDYYIKINILPNFEKASKIQFYIIQNTRQKDISFVCGNKTLNGNYDRGELNNISFFKNNNINECYLKLHYKFNSQEEITNFQFDTIKIGFNIYDTNNKKIQKYITLRPISVSNTSVLNSDCSYYFLDDNGQITDNLITNYNGFGGYIHYQNPNPNKKLKYIKLTAQLLDNNLSNPNPYFIFQRDGLLNEKKMFYIPTYKKVIENTLYQNLIRNDTEYQVILPFQQSTIQAINNTQLVQTIQPKTNLSTWSGDKEGKVKLTCQFVYVDDTTENKNGVASFKVIGGHNKDYISVNVYNAEAANDPIYARQLKYDGNGNNACKSSDYGPYLNRKCGYFYAILEMSYYHLHSSINLSNNRVPNNTNGDVNPNGYPLDENGITHGITYISTNYLGDYFPSYKGTKMYGYSIKDAISGPHTWWGGANTPNNYYTYHGSSCGTYRTSPKKPPIYDSSRGSYLGEGYGGYKTIKITGNIKWHATKLFNGANNSDTISQVWGIGITEKDGYNENDVIWDYYPNYSKLQFNNLNGKKEDDVAKLVPKVILAKEFKGEVNGLKLRFYPPEYNKFNYVPGKSNTINTKFELLIDLKEHNINNIKNNALYKIIEEGANKPFFTMQIPMIVGGNYAGIDNISVSLGGNTTSEKQNHIFKNKNDKILEYNQKNQRKVMVDMTMAVKKYIKSIYEKGYLHSWAHTYYRCRKHHCRCVLHSKGSNWIHQGFFEYKLGESNFKQEPTVYNNYVLKIYQPSEKVGIITNAYIKNMPTYYFVGKNINKNNGNLKEYYLPPGGINLDDTRLGDNKKMDYISYLFKTFDFPKKIKDGYEYYNLKDTLETNNTGWQMIMYTNSKDLYIEDKGDNQVKYRGKKIIYVDGDLYINSNLLPATKNDYIYLIVNGNVYLNSNASIINIGLNIFKDLIALDGEKTLLLVGPLNVGGYILNYRKATHSFPDIKINGSWFNNVLLQGLMKNSLLIGNDYRFLKQPIIIKKIFSVKRF